MLKIKMKDDFHPYTKGDALLSWMDSNILTCMDTETGVYLTCKQVLYKVESDPGVVIYLVDSTGSSLSTEGSSALKTWMDEMREIHQASISQSQPLTLESLAAMTEHVINKKVSGIKTNYTLLLNPGNTVEGKNDFLTLLGLMAGCVPMSLISPFQATLGVMSKQATLTLKGNMESITDFLLLYDRVHLVVVGASSQKICPDLCVCEECCAGLMPKIEEAYSTSPIKEPESPTPPWAQSQKAKGILALGEAGVEICQDILIHPGQTEESLQAWSKGGAAFCRPCPLTPRHGFVPSRIIPSISLAALKELEEEIREKAPEEIVEIVLMRPIAAEWSGIVTDTSITIGRGTDGATAGRECLTVDTGPRTIQAILSSSYSPELLEKAGIQGSPMVEVLIKDGKIIPVQLRDGMQVQGNDFIPKRMKVKAVYDLTPEMEWEVWEPLVRALASGTVVYFKGGSLTSHLSIHAIAAGVPIFTSHRPVVGTYITPRNKGMDLGRLSSCLTAQLGAWTYGFGNETTNRVKMAFHLFHNLGQNMVEGREGIVAWILLDMVMAAVAACYGEIRYYKKKLPAEAEGWKGLGRNYVYDRVFDNPLAYIRTFPKIVVRFMNSKGWSGGYGGLAWLNCGSATIAAVRGIREFLLHPTPTRLTNLIQAVNVLVNVQHNGGTMYQKYGVYGIFGKHLLLYPPIMEMLERVNKLESPLTERELRDKVIPSLRKCKGKKLRKKFNLSGAQVRILTENMVRFQSKSGYSYMEHTVALSGGLPWNPVDDPPTSLSYAGTGALYWPVQATAYIALVNSRVEIQRGEDVITLPIALSPQVEMSVGGKTGKGKVKKGGTTNEVPF